MEKYIYIYRKEWKAGAKRYLCHRLLTKDYLSWDGQLHRRAAHRHGRTACGKQSAHECDGEKVPGYYSSSPLHFLPPTTGIILSHTYAHTHTFIYIYARTHKLMRSCHNPNLYSLFPFSSHPYYTFRPWEWAAQFADERGRRFQAAWQRVARLFQRAGAKQWWGSGREKIQLHFVPTTEHSTHLSQINLTECIPPPPPSQTTAFHIFLHKPKPLRWQSCLLQGLGLKLLPFHPLSIPFRSPIVLSLTNIILQIRLVTRVLLQLQLSEQQDGSNDSPDVQALLGT